jgi:hypothetical protein
VIAARLRTDLGDLLAPAWTAGTTMSLEEVVTFAQALADEDELNPNRMG